MHVHKLFLLVSCVVSFLSALVHEGVTVDLRGATSSFPQRCSKRTDVNASTGEKFVRKKKILLRIVEILEFHQVGRCETISELKVISVFRFCALIDRELLETPTTASDTYVRVPPSILI